MLNNATKIFLVLNSGSSSEKFSLYEGEDEVCSLYFEGIEENGEKKYICTITRADGVSEIMDKKWDTLDVAFKEAKAIFEEEGFINEAHPLDGILVRVVAAGKYFSKNHIVDARTFEEFEKVRVTNPLHVPGTEKGIKNATVTFPDVPVIIMSDSEALVCDTRRDIAYALPSKVIDEFDLGRWGAHGASYGYMMERIVELGLLEKRMVICHLGSGCSVTALIDGKPASTIAALLGEKMGAVEAIKLMNKESGLLALAGSSDMREIIAGVEEDKADAAEAYNLFVDGVVGKIGEFAAKMGGLDAIVFTATIGERSFPVRSSIVSKLEFMGFKMNNDVSVDKSAGYVNVASEESKPIYVIPTNEAAYMIKKAAELLDTE